MIQTAIARTGKPRRRGTPRNGNGRGNRPDELWAKFLRTRWKKHRNLLVETYLPLVRAVAEQIVSRLPRTVDHEDLISAGVCGLLHSVEHYDPRRGTRFETFCRMRVRGAMIDELRTQDILSRDARDRANRIGEALHRLRQELGREPSSEELAGAMGLTPREVRDTLRSSATRTMVSLDHHLRECKGCDDHGSSWSDLVDTHLEPPEEVHRKDLLHLIRDSLTDAERDILMLRYRDGLTMRRIGGRLGLSESRVCQVHGRLLARLHRRLLAAEA